MMMLDATQANSDVSLRLLIMMAQAYFPRQAGGVQTVTKELVRAFEAAGHRAAVAAELSFRGAAGLNSATRLLLTRGKYSRESYDGHQVFRARNITTKAIDIVESFRPDCVVVQSMDAMKLAHAISDHGIPLVICWHDVETQRMNGETAGLVARYVANSEFTASVYQTMFGVRSTVIPPVIRRDAYHTADIARRNVTFINPVPEKGVDLAIEVARACPDIPFEFVESWILEPATRRALLARLATLPNVRFTGHQNDMRPIYQRTRILLAPSQWREAWGRVASEAHVSGIPVIGSRIGGLVEAVGPGGVLIPPEAPAAAWIGAVRSLWDDTEQYRALSARARAYSERPELQLPWATGRMLDEIRSAIAMRGFAR